MKRICTLLVSVVVIIMSSCSTFDDGAIWDKLVDHENRISRLEEMCREMNTNIDALQTIVAALQTNDYVTSVTPITENGETIGYTISFVKSAPITIYHGTNGKDGQNGVDGSDGYTPVIGVKQDSDGIYYWTVDGEWLLDGNGLKIKAQGTDGKDGEDGEDGEDGITPQLKIENGYWYISYDNGITWTELGKATGEDGADGNDGTNGKDGDSFFKSVTYDEDYVYLVLADGTALTLPRAKSQKLDIVFDKEGDIMCGSGQTVEVGYTIVGGDDATVVECLGDGDWSAMMEATDATSGTIRVSAPKYDDIGKVVVFATSGDGRVVMKALHFVAKPFDISVTDVEMIRAAIKITPSDTKETFCWMCGVWDGEQTAEDIMNGIVAMYGSWMNGGAMLYTGVQDYTGGPGSPYKYKLDSPDTDYYVIAFGYAGGITTEPEMVTFRTLPAPDPATTTFTMSASDITPYSLKFSVVPSHSTTYYSCNVCAPEEYNEEAIIKAENEAFDWMLEQYKQFNPDATVAMVLSNYYYRDAATADATGLVPESDFMGYVVVYNFEDGHVLKIHKFENLATTKSRGSITPGVELVGYYSGDEENGSVFGEPAATKGKAITVVKYTNFDGARSLFATMLGDNMTNTSSYSDSYIWGIAAQYWTSIKTSEPYSFYVADWDYVQTALAYAVDQNGLPGGIGRLYTMPTAENKGDIADLKSLVDELDANKSPYTLSL